MSAQELRLLEAILFDETVSRNRNFDAFEEAETKRVHRIAKMLRSLGKELRADDVRHWTEPTDDGRLCLHLHRPLLSAKREVFLTQEQWDLLCRVITS